MIDTQTETLVPISKAREHVPSKPHTATIWRWVLTGCRGVRLETLLIGGKRYTSEDAIRRFFAETTAAGSRQKPTRAPLSQSRQRAIEQADRDFSGTRH